MTEKPSDYGAIENGKTDDNGNHIENEKPEEPKQQHSILGISFIMLGSFSFSVMFLMVKLMAATNTFTLVFYRSLIQIALSLFAILQKGHNPLGPPGVRGWLVMRGLFGAIAVCAWFFGIQILPLPDAVTLQFTTPAFAAAIAVCLVGEPWLPLDIVGAVVCLTGVALIAHPTWLFGSAAGEDDEDVDPLMKLLAVAVTTGGAASAGFAYVLVRKIGHDATAQVMVLYYAVLSIPLVIIGHGMFGLGWFNVWELPGLTAKDVVLLILMGLGGYGGQWFTNLGLQIETAATGTLATSTQIVWTYIFEMLFLHEPLNYWSMAGTGLILGFMILVGCIKMKAMQQEEVEPLLRHYSSSL